MTYTVAVVGATGAVGQQMIQSLEKRKFPVGKLIPLASSRSAGGTVQFQGKAVTVLEAAPDSFEGVDIALFSAGGGVSKFLAPEAVKHGAVVIDNSSAFRMDENVPLVVPEVNREALSDHQGIIANPNCSTIQMVVALKPLQDEYGLERVIVSTYQAVSGAGSQAIEELRSQAAAMLVGEEPVSNLLPVGKLDKHYPIAFNALPQIDVSMENGFTFEEMKMVQETKKILCDDNLGITPTCVRIPVYRGHSEAVYAELKDDYQLSDVRSLLKNFPGIIIQDDLEQQVYPMPLEATGHDAIFVGRLRRDLAHPKGLNMWIVSDNLLKGAAINAVQIAEALVEDQRIRRG